MSPELRKVLRSINSYINEVPSPAYTLMWLAWLVISFYPVITSRSLINFVVPFLIMLLLLREGLNFYRRRQYFAPKRAFTSLVRQRLANRKYLHLRSEGSEWVIQRTFLKLALCKLDHDDVREGHQLSEDPFSALITTYLVTWNAFAVLKHTGSVPIHKSPDDLQFTINEDFVISVSNRDLNRFPDIVTADAAELDQLTAIISSAAEV